mmetsp:Transcript_53250/g.113827  ORF Transcript_53250/g.113827 Transcript_53250/m.113827 type:complete len:439 (+) Transcript_53250:76-1392(+)
MIPSSSLARELPLPQPGPQQHQHQQQQQQRRLHRLHLVIVVVLFFGCLVTTCSALKDPRGQRQTTSDLEIGRATTQLTKAYPFYHTGSELQSEAHRIVSSCEGADAQIKSVSKGDVNLDMVTVRHKEATPINKVFMLFGEHSRELISPETGLHLLKALCGDAKLSEGSLDPQQALLQSEFALVLNANPNSRKSVEGGSYCVRENPAGVDLNRNWDSRWSPKEAAFGDTAPGSAPFSEVETQLLRDLLTAYKPTSFMSIHSGTLGLYMPWAYDREHAADRNKDSMLQVLTSVDAKHCKCPFGAAGKEVGYPCPGTSMDWAYDVLKTPYSFAYEIYIDPASASDLHDRWEEKMKNGGAALLELGESLSHQHFRGLHPESAPSDFIQVQEFTDMSVDNCLKQFNPIEKNEYDKVVDNWASAFLDTAHQIAKELASQTQTSI